MLTITGFLNLGEDEVLHLASEFCEELQAFGKLGKLVKNQRSSGASLSSTATSKARNNRRQKKREKICPESPGEEMVLVEHLKGMSLTPEARCELKSLFVSLMMLAVRLAEETMSNNTINEQTYFGAIQSKSAEPYARFGGILLAT
ncbi:hypothetical protein PIB30_073800 [Stylosanthes scabra]|uniref:Uncharacterized protein n=1 Tax=Stylosanthes scabra TaxID=79078 RepID=A0ABU6SPP1_9FABA|nr:hypothetical protein [Stylosanthes scabra]